MSSRLEKRLSKRTLCLPMTSPLHTSSTTNSLSPILCGGVPICWRTWWTFTSTYFKLICISWYSIATPHFVPPLGRFLGHINFNGILSFESNRYFIDWHESFGQNGSLKSLTKMINHWLNLEKFVIAWIIFV